VTAPDFIAIGHVTLDRFGDTVRAGGAALYAAVTADRLGLSAAILTSHADDFPLHVVPSRIEVVTVPAGETTTFEHSEHEGERVLHVRAAAAALSAGDLPEDWKDAPLVMLAPVLAEVDPLLSMSFSDAAVSAQAQGWLRVVEPDGAVGSLAWEPDYLLARLQTLFLSQRDVLGQEAAMLEWLQRVPVGVVTAGRHGALLYVNGERYEVRPRAAREVDVTGAGDVFAATFLVRYQEEGNPWTAAEAAACAAALSIEGEGWSAVPDAPALERALAEYRRDDTTS
jgi:sugar/nucleoside kinase (ribokinase family)